MFSFLKNIYTQVTSKLRGLFSRASIDSQTLHELEKLLLSADTGVQTTRVILDNLQKQVSNGTITSGSDLHRALAQLLQELLEKQQYTYDADVYLLVGINGSGKTTCVAKLGYWLKNQNKQVLVVAADTFRAAAVEQLVTWAKKLSLDYSTGKPEQDPASVVFAGCEKFKSGEYTSLIIDTAGRLQTKVNLMKELEKIKRSITKQLPDKKITTLLTIDAMLGQNSFEQARLFNESTHVDGVILTKMDGTGKGGIVFSITQELKIPVAFLSFGEQPDQLALFNAHDYVTQLLSKE